MTGCEWLGLAAIWCVVGVAVLRWSMRRYSLLPAAEWSWSPAEAGLALVLVVLWPVLVVL